MFAREKEGDRREHSRCPRGRLKAKVSSRGVTQGRKQGDASLWGTFVGPVRKCWGARDGSGRERGEYLPLAPEGLSKVHWGR